MRVLVTGSAGQIGRHVIPALAEKGYDIRSMDRIAMRPESGHEHVVGDVRDALCVRRAVTGVDAVVHLAAIPNDRFGLADEVLATNVQGTWNALIACHEAGVGRLVFMSSINSLGNFGGHRPARYLPIDDDYPHHPMTPYQMSKHLAEEACRSFTEAYGITTLCLRPVAVMSPEHYERWRQHRGGWRREWGKGDYWAYVDVRDVCDIVLRCLEIEGVRHDSFVLAAPDTSSDTPTADLIAEYYPDTDWRIDRDAYLSADPHVALVDCRHAAEALGVRPVRSWRADS